MRRPNSNEITAIWCVAIMICDFGAVALLALFIGPLISQTAVDYKFANAISALEFFGSIGLVCYMGKRTIEFQKFMKSSIPNQGKPQAIVGAGAAPTWVLVVGCLFGVLTLLFFMALILLAVFGHEVPSNSRFLVVAVFSFGAALSSSFVGGHAAANGHIPLPFAKTHPVKFGVMGGIAVLIVVMLISYFLYIHR